MLEVESNGTAISLASIPVYTYPKFYEVVDGLMADQHEHCVAYFAVPQYGGLVCYCCMANDSTHKLQLLSYTLQQVQEPLPSLTAKHYAFHCYERELHENWGIPFTNHPWLKPLRYPFNRYNQSQKRENYPFYTICGEELHEVGVGPIHAGIIEPGYFRFICNGERILHLESVMGYQHRGIEQLMLDKKTSLQRAIIAESIAGDMAVASSLAYAMCCESLSETDVSDKLQLERIVAVELGRIAVHIGDTGALCMDVAYQLGQVACEALRTIIINTTQLWCGNRFGKGFIRPNGTHYPLTPETVLQIRKNLDEVEYRYNQVAERIFTSPSVLSRFEEVGILTNKQARSIGVVGLTARASGISRDLRHSHPFQYYRQLNFNPLIQETGDVQARALLRRYEVQQSIQLVKLLLEKHEQLGAEVLPKPDYNQQMKPNSMAIGLVESWRGELCHVAVTNERGELICYKIKEASMHNWLALSLAARNQEVSDFPICNKSFNLSYCGHDL